MPKSSHWLTVKNSDTAAEMFICGSIGQSWWDDSGVSEKEFRDELSKIPKGKKITVTINSEGGSIKDGLGIYNALSERRADVTTVNGGYALSISSVLMLAGSRRISPRSSLWMIHEPWTTTTGNAEDHLKSAEMLDQHGEMLSSIYEDRVGKPRAEMRELMRKEHWMTGEEAVGAGFADECPEEDDDTKDALAALDVSRFHNIPAHIQNILKGASNGDRNNEPLRSTGVPTDASGQGQPPLTLAPSTSLPVCAGGATNQPDANASAQTKETKMSATTNAAPVADAASASVIAELQSQLKAERRARIEARVRKYVEDRKISQDEVEIYADAAVSDEAKTFGVLDKLPAKVDPKPIGTDAEVIADGPVDQIKRDFPTPQGRFKTMCANFPHIFNECARRDSRRTQSVQNSNTYSATLVTSFLIDGFITKLQNRWALLKAFSRDFSTDPYKPLATGVLKHVTAGSTTGTDLTNFEAGNSTVDVVSCTMHQYSQPFQVSNTDLNSGLRMENLIEVNVAALADKITAIATAPITLANFTATATVKPAASFGFDDLATLWGQLKKSPIKNLLLDGEYLARIINTPTLFQIAGTDQGAGWSRFGWDGIYLNTNWTGASNNAIGFACHPQAIAVVAGLPLNPPDIPGAVLTQNNFTVPDVNVSVAAYQWFSLASRTMWLSYDIMLGAAKADATAGIIVASA